jgi:hypothetical protein
MSKIELPELPEHAAAWVIPGDDGGSLGKWVDAKPFSEDEFTAPLFTAAQLRARDRQIVEVCIQAVAAAGPKEGPLKLVTDGFVDALRNLIEETNQGSEG